MSRFETGYFPRCTSAWAVIGLLLAAESLGCSKPAVAPPALHGAPRGDGIERPPLTGDEAQLKERLEAHVAELARKIGERNPGQPWELAAAADYVALQFEELGFAVERFGYEVDGVAVQNLAVTIPGTDRSEEMVVVGAYYDSAPGSSGENANATGVAALLELARLFRDARNRRTLRLVAFALSSPPYAGGENMGSLRYARELERTSQDVVGMISLDRIGVLAGPGGRAGVSQVRLGATAGAEGLRESLEREVDALPLSVKLIPIDVSEGSDHGAFARLGYPAVWVTGTGNDEPIDYDGMSRLVMRVRFGLAEILGERPTNDGMLTPDMGLVR